MTSNSPALWERAQTPELAQFLQAHPTKFQRGIEPNIVGTTDDWPYIYHHTRTIPRTYLTITAILIVMATVLFGRKLTVRDAATWHFMLLGAGFLCMETQLVSRSALYFGNTWLVNCFAVSAILAVLMLANVFVQRVGAVRIQKFFTVLIVSLLLNYLFPWSKLPLGVTQTGLLLYLAYAVPLFCAGVIFADSFRRSEQKSLALGANLFGATLGGVSQNLAFIFGLKALLLVSAVLYTGAWISVGRSMKRETKLAPEMELATTSQ